MIRSSVVLMVVALVGATFAPDAGARRKKSQLGVFGKINGKTFKATNLEGVNDACVNGIFNVSQKILTFGALECGKRRRRQGVAVKKNYKFVALGCSAGADPALLAAAPPYELPCYGSAYSEYKTGRFKIPVSTTTWGANFDLSVFPPTSNLRARIDAFDGTTIRGAFFGVFEVPLVGTATPPAQVSGEVRFELPIKAQ